MVLQPVEYYIPVMSTIEMFCAVLCTTLMHNDIHTHVALQRADMRMVRWRCSVKLQDRVPSRVQRLGLDNNLGTTAKQFP